MRVLTFEGYCPVQEKQYSITIPYLDDGFGGGIKGVANCDYAKHHNCSVKCPIIEEAPSNI